MLRLFAGGVGLLLMIGGVAAVVLGSWVLLRLIKQALF